MKQKQFINPSNHLLLSAGLKLRPCQGFLFFDGAKIRHFCELCNRLRENRLLFLFFRVKMEVFANSAMQLERVYSGE